MHLIPAAAAIDFYGEVYVTDWGPAIGDDSLHVVQYQNRTTSRQPIEINQRKIIYLPNRVKRGSVVTHGCIIKEGYKTYVRFQYYILSQHMEFWHMLYQWVAKTNTRLGRLVCGLTRAFTSCTHKVAM